MTLPEQHWRSPPPHLSLTGDEIHVWLASLDQPLIWVEEMSQSLSNDEHKRADLFHFEQDRRRFLVGHAVFRRILGAYLDLDPGKVQLSFGKPCLAK